MSPEPARGAGSALTVADVVERMRRISAELPERDGVRAFNEMYLETTRQVSNALEGLSFADRAFMDRLDIRFAELYFGALEAHGVDPDSAPRCWATLIEARARRGVSPLQFALAGMNAHITFDLPRALVMTAVEFGGDLDDRARRADFLEINDVLARTQPLVKEVLLTGPFAAIDDALGDVDDRLRMWAIEGAREMAWKSARMLWAVRDCESGERFTQGLDRMVELSSRFLLRL